MGSDIYGSFQKQTLPGIWVDIETEYKFNRHYQFFAFIGDVRNGYGFAGIKTGEPIKSPLAHRDLPGEIKKLNEEYENYGQYVDDCTYYGEYSRSHFLLKEYLESLNTLGNITKTCIISKEDHLEWSKTSVLESGLRKEPECSTFGGIYGKDILVVNDNAVELNEYTSYTHVRIEYEINLKDEFQYFTDEVNRLIEVHGTDQIRFVYGFD